MKYSDYPMVVEDERELSPDYDGPLFVWDVDKTYLATSFSSLNGLLRIPLEWAVDKHAIAGMPEVLRGLRRGSGKRYASHPLYFVTASPPQMARVLKHRMLLDGVEYDGLTFKNWVLTIKEGRPGRLKEQAGYKLNALLRGRVRRPMCREYLFGDDVEADAVAFSLYARIINQKLGGGDLEQAMMDAEIKEDDRRLVHGMLDKIPQERGSVENIFIHLIQKTSPEAFAHYGPILVPV
ncbi:hypothetical protein KAI87_15885, partial [Myxococcota bacterium]|nr:hypothetical protein [Myxococcota bacterium]